MADMAAWPCTNEPAERALFGELVEEAGGVALVQTHAQRKDLTP